MKFILVMCACLSWSTGWAIQTAPTPTSSSSQTASGTKNVGNDRADAPQAPGMTSSTKSSTLTIYPPSSRKDAVQTQRKKTKL